MEHTCDVRARPRKPADDSPDSGRAAKVTPMTRPVPTRVANPGRLTVARGISLVEIMIALVLGLFLMAGLLQVPHQLPGQLGVEQKTHYSAACTGSWA